MRVAVGGGGWLSYQLAHAVFHVIMGTYPEFRIDSAVGLSGGAWALHGIRTSGPKSKEQILEMQQSGHRRTSWSSTLQTLPRLSPNVMNALGVLSSLNCDWQSVIRMYIRNESACTLDFPLQVGTTADCDKEIRPWMNNLFYALPYQFVVLESKSCLDNFVPHNLPSSCTEKLTGIEMSQADALAATSNIFGIVHFNNIVSPLIPFVKSVLAPSCSTLDGLSVSVNGINFSDGCFTKDPSDVQVSSEQKKMVVVRSWDGPGETEFLATESYRLQFSSWEIVKLNKSASIYTALVVTYLMNCGTDLLFYKVDTSTYDCLHGDATKAMQIPSVSAFLRG